MLGVYLSLGWPLLNGVLLSPIAPLLVHLLVLLGEALRRLYAWQDHLVVAEAALLQAVLALVGVLPAHR